MFCYSSRSLFKSFRSVSLAWILNEYSSFLLCSWLLVYSRVEIFCSLKSTCLVKFSRSLSRSDTFSFKFWHLYWYCVLFLSNSSFYSALNSLDSFRMWISAISFSSRIWLSASLCFNWEVNCSFMISRLVTCVLVSFFWLQWSRAISYYNSAALLSPPYNTKIYLSFSSKILNNLLIISSRLYNSAYLNW